MKLHLPFGLRKALMTCLAAIAAHALPLTISSGAGAAGSAAIFTILAAQQTPAEEEEEDLIPLSEITAFPEGYQPWTGQESDTLTPGYWSFEAPTGTGNNTPSIPDFLLPSSPDELAGINLMFTASGNNEVKFTKEVSGIHSLYLTGLGSFADGGMFMNGSGPQELYIQGAQLNFSCWNGYESGYNSLQTTFIIGESNYTGAPDDSLRNAALRLGKSVHTSGDLILLDNAKIAFQADAKGIGSLEFEGALLGEGYTLTVSQYNIYQNNYYTLSFGNGGILGSIDATGSKVTIALNGSNAYTFTHGGSIAGTLQLGSGATLNIGEALQLETLNIGSGNAEIAFDQSSKQESAKLTINNLTVNNGQALSIGEGINVTLTGAATIQSDTEDTNLNISEYLHADAATIQWYSSNITLSKGGCIGTLALGGSTKGATMSLGGDLFIDNINTQYVGARTYSFINENEQGIIYLTTANASVIKNLIETKNTSGAKAFTIDQENVGLGVVGSLSTSASVTLENGLDWGNGHFKIQYGSLILGADASIGSLHMEKSSSLVLNNHTLTLTSLHINKNNVSMQLSDGGYISGLTSASTTGGMLTIHLTGWDYAQQSAYALFKDGNFDNKWWNFINVELDGTDLDDLGLEIAYNPDGSINLREANTAIWKPEADGSFTWGTENDWTQGNDDNARNSVIFNATNATGALTVESNINQHTGSMTVRGGAVEFDFHGNTLTLDNKLIITDGASAQFAENDIVQAKEAQISGRLILTNGDNALTISGNFIGEGTLELAGSSTTTLLDSLLGKDGSSIGYLEISDTASAQISGSALSHVVSGVIIGAGSSLTLTSAATQELDNLQLGGSLLLGNYELTVTDLTILSSAKGAALSGALTVTDELLGSGSLSLQNGASLTLQSNSAQEFAGALSMAANSSLSLKANLTIDTLNGTGSATINAANRTLRVSKSTDYEGTLTMTGNLEFGGGSTGPIHTLDKVSVSGNLSVLSGGILKLNSGGNISQTLTLNDNTELKLGGDIVLQKLTLGTNGISITNSKLDTDGNGENVYIIFDYGSPSAGDNVQSKWGDAFKAFTDATSQYNIGPHVGVGKTGLHTMKLGSATIDVDLKIAEGAVDFNNGNSTLTGVLSGSGELIITSTLDMTSLSAHTFTGALSMGSNSKLKLAGNLTVSELLHDSGSATFTFTHAAASNTAGTKLAVQKAIDYTGDLIIYDEVGNSKGTLELKQGGSISGALMFQGDNNQSADLSLILGASLKTAGLNNGRWNKNDITTISSSAEKDITLTIKNTTDTFQWGSQIIGSNTNKIHLVKDGIGEQAIGQGTFTLYGNATIDDGTLRFYDGNNNCTTYKKTIKGKVSGKGALKLWNTELTIEGYKENGGMTAGSIGSLLFDGNTNNTLTLGADLEIGALSIVNTANFQNKGDEDLIYLIFNTSDTTDISDLLGKVKTSKATIATGVGLGKSSTSTWTVSDTSVFGQMAYDFKVKDGKIDFSPASATAYAFDKTLQIESGATITASKGATITLTGGLSGKGTVELNGGALVMGSGKDLTIGSLKLTADGSSLTLANKGKLNLGSFTRSSSDSLLRISLTGNVGTLDIAWSYQLFDTTKFDADWWELVDIKNLSIAGLDTSLYKVAVDTRDGAVGKLRLAYANLSGLYHDVSADANGSFTWTEDGNTWDVNAYDSPLDAEWTTEVGVHLRTSAGATGYVTLSADDDGAVQTKELAVDGGTLIFTGDKLELAEGLTVNTGAKALFTADLELAKGAQVHGGGTLGVTGSGATLTLDVTQLDLANTDSEGAPNAGKFTGTLKAADGGTLALTGAWTGATAGYDLAGGTLQLGTADKAASLSLSATNALALGGLSFTHCTALQMEILRSGNQTTSATISVGESGIRGLSAENELKLTFGDAFAAMDSAALREALGKTGVQLFDVSGWSNKTAGWNTWFSFTNPTDENAWRYSLKLKDDGRFVYTVNPLVNFVWDGTRGTAGTGDFSRQLVWSAEDEDHEWRLKDATHDVQYDLWMNDEDANVLFDNGGKKDEIVVDGKVGAGKVTVQSGQYVYRSMSGATQDDLTFTGKLSVAKGASIEFNLEGTVKNHGTAKGGSDRVDWYMANVHLQDVDLQGSMLVSGSVEILGNLTGNGDITISGRVVNSQAEEREDIDLLLNNTDEYYGRIIFIGNADTKLLPDRRIASRLRIQNEAGVVLNLHGGIMLGKNGAASDGLLEFTADDQKIYINTLTGNGQLRLQGSNHSVASQPQQEGNLYKSYFGEVFIEKDSTDFKGGFNVYDDIVVRLNEGVSMTVNGIRGWLGNYGGESDASDNTSATLYVNLTENINTATNQQSATNFNFKKGFTLEFNGGNYTQALDARNFYTQEGQQTIRHIVFENDLRINSGTLSVRHISDLLDGEVDMRGGVLEFRADTYITSTFVRSDAKAGTLRLYGVKAQVLTGGQTGTLQFALNNNATIELGGDLTVAKLSFADAAVTDTHITRYEPTATEKAVTLRVEDFGLDFNSATARALTIGSGIDAEFEQEVKIGGGSNSRYTLDISGKADFETSLNLYKSAYVHLSGDSTAKLLNMGDNTLHNGQVVVDSHLTAKELRGTVATPTISGAGTFELAWDGTGGSYSGHILTDWLYSGKGDFEMKGYFGLENEPRRNLTVTNGYLLFGADSKQNIWGKTLTIGTQGATYLAKTPTLEISTAVSKNFDRVELHDDGRLIVSNAANWKLATAGNVTNTTGTLELRNLKSGKTESSEYILNLLMGNEKGSNTLGYLELTGSTALTVQKENSLLAFDKVKNVLIDKKASLVMQADNTYKTHVLQQVDVRGTLDLQNGGAGAGITAHHLATQGTQGIILISITGEAGTTGLGSKINLDTWQAFTEGSQLAISLGEGSDDVLNTLIDKRYKLFTDGIGESWLQNAVTGSNPYKNWSGSFRITDYDKDKYYIWLDDEGYLNILDRAEAGPGDIDDELYWDGGVYADAGKPYDSFTWNTWAQEDPNDGITDWRLGPEGEYVDFSYKNVHFTSLVKNSTVSFEGDIHARNMTVYRNAYVFYGAAGTANDPTHSLTVDNLTLYGGEFSDVTFKNSVVTVLNKLSSETSKKNERASATAVLQLDNATLNAQTGGNMGYMYLRGKSTLNLGGDFTLLDGFEASAADYASASVGGITSAIKSTSAEARDIELALQVLSEQRSLWGDVTVGESDKRINITKSGEGMQRFGHGAFTLHGDLVIEEGAVGFNTFTGNGISAKKLSHIYGTVSGGSSALLSISGGHTLTVHGKAGLAGSIRTLHFEGTGEASTLGLEGGFTAHSLSLGTAAHAAVLFGSSTANFNTFTVNEKWIEDAEQAMTISTSAAAGKTLLKKGADISGTLTLNKGVQLLIEDAAAQLTISGAAHLHGGGSLAGNLALTGGLLTVGDTVTTGTMTDGTTGAIVFDAQEDTLHVQGGSDMSGALIIRGTATNQGGTVKLSKTATIGGTLTLSGKMDVQLGEDLSVAGLVQNTKAATRTEANRGGAGGVVITSTGATSLLTINAQEADSALWGDFTLGSANKNIALTKKGEKTQSFGNAVVTLNSEVEIQDGTLSFRQTAENSIITGAVSRGEVGYVAGEAVPGMGFLELAGGYLTLAQGGCVYGLDMRQYDTSADLTLGKDLEVFEFRAQHPQAGTVRNGATSGDVYLIWNVGDAGKDNQNTDAFLNAYTYDHASVGKSGAGVLTFTQGAGLATAKNFKIFETQVIFTAEANDAPGSYVINGNFLGEDDTTLTVGKADLSLMSGGTTSGWVELAGNTKAPEETNLNLGNTLTAAGLLGTGGYVNTAAGTDAATLRLVVAGIPDGITEGDGAEAPNTIQPVAENVTFGAGVSLLKEGEGSQKILGSSAFNGEHITVTSGQLTLHGAAAATGHVRVTKGALALTGSADKEVQGSISVSGAESVFTAANLNQSDATEATLVTNGGHMSIYGRATLTGATSITGGGVLSLGGEEGDSFSLVTGDMLISGAGSALELSMHEWKYGMKAAATLEKGAHLALTQTELPGSFLVADIVLAELTLGSKAANGISGTLTWADATGNQDLRIDKLSGSGTLDAQNFDGTAESNDHRHLYLEYIHDFEGAVTGSYSEQNGANKLYVGTIDMAADKEPGSISLSKPSDALLYAKTFRKKGEGDFSLGNVVQIERGLWMTHEGNIRWDESLETYRRFAMCNQVTLHYEEPSAQLIDGANGKELAGLAKRFELHSSLFMPNWRYISLDITGVKVAMFEERNNADSPGGYYLGIVHDTASAQAQEIYNKLTDKSFVLLDDVDVENDDYEIKWLTGNDGLERLYLYFNHINDDNLNEDGTLKKSPQLWDTRWDQHSNPLVLTHAPSETTMNRHTYKSGDADIFGNNKSRPGTSFEAQALELSTDGDAEYVDRGKGWAYIRLETAENISAPAHAHAAVIGGTIYTEKAALQEEIDTFISYAPIVEKSSTAGAAPVAKISKDGTEYVRDDNAWLHLLVGGSSCLATSSGDVGERALGGFVGDTHIQMDGGNVDYIVGGNHVNNSTFTFKGDSYISIFNGNVRGGIVGGSTLTRGANNSSLYAFQGDSFIHIYSVLSNTAQPADDLSISTGTATGATDGGATFYAVVGGNAWVDVADPASETRMTPTFRGNSTIYIDLLNQQTKGLESSAIPADTNLSWDGTSAFDKDIVGANYTAIKTNGGDNSAHRNTLFRGNTSIEIIADADKGHTFTGGISGASRRASGGEGATVFNGNAQISIAGGAYQSAVAGGFWFESTATGDHNSYLLGNTTVTIIGGEFWRVAGGSWSLGGGAGASEIQVGSSAVHISGGSFENTATEQTDIGFVIGGDFYRSNQGEGHRRLNGSDFEMPEALKGMDISVGDALKGDTSVEITGGSFLGMHIIGGDYANASPETGSSNSMSTSIGGKSSVTLSQGVEINGFVAGGSYLYDNSAGGKVAAHETAVLVDGANVIAESGHEYHKGLAIVGGHVLIDEGATHGDHEAVVESRTTLTFKGESSIIGDIAGGSFANKSNESNALSAGNVSISIALAKDSSITGRIYGGHYSMNTSAPDALSIDDISISMTGGKVKGDIVGGGFRMTAADFVGDSSTQGNISITLTGGEIAGNVYAAGYNGSVESSGKANTTTTSTHISISEAYAFTRTDGEDVIISGGYGRASEGVQRGSITNNARLTFRGTNASINNYGNHVRLEDVNVVDVQNEGTIAVDTELFVLKDKSNFTKEGTGTLSVARLTMRDAADRAEKADRYTGMITVDDGYLVLTGDTALSEENNQTLSGGLTVNLSKYRTHYREQDKAYLQNHKNTANGVLFVDEVGSSPAPAQKSDLHFSGLDKLGGSIYFGLYYLATGLDEAITRENMDAYFNYSAAVGELEDALSGRENYYWLDVQIFDNSLVLRVRHELEKDGWWWTGESSDTWTNDPTSPDKWEHELTFNWTQQETQLEHYDPTDATKADGDTDGEHHAFKLTPRGKDVHFGAGAVAGRTTVQLNSEIDARSAWVEQNQYTFTGKGELYIGDRAIEAFDHDSDLTEYALNHRLQAGELAVGGTYLPDVAEYTPAELTLQVEAHMARALLKDKGTLVLDHSAAVDKQAELVFAGGTLAYGAAGLFKDDLSAQVNAAMGGSNPVRLRVGDTGRTQDAAHTFISTAPKGAELSIAWGSSQATRTLGGIAQALDQGLIKTGVGSLVFTWSGTAAENVDGSLKALEGALTYRRMGSGTATLMQAYTTDNVEVAERAKLIFETGDGAELSIARAIEGGGHVVVGSRELKGQNYTLSGDNSGLSGVLELYGNSSATADDLVALGHEQAPGAENTTLRLAGRHFLYTGSAGEKTVAVKEIQVTDKSSTYVGGLTADAANEHITLRSKLVQTDANGDAAKSDYSGILANAWGSDNGQQAFHHTIVGDLTQYRGTILAGAAATRGISLLSAAEPGTSASTWTLTNDATTTQMLGLTLGGAGSFIFAYSADVRLTGQIGTTEAGEANALTSLVNATDGHIIYILDGTGSDWRGKSGKNIATGSLSGAFQLGEEANFGTWAGKSLAADAVFTLVNGMLQNAMTKEADSARLIVHTAYTDKAADDTLRNTSTRVNVGGTDGSMFDAVTITAGGQMLDLTGELLVDGSHSMVNLTFGAADVANTYGTPEQYMIVARSKDSGTKLTVTESGLSDFTLNVDNSAFRAALINALGGKEGHNDTYLHVVGNGLLNIDSTLNDALLTKVKGDNLDLLSWIGFTAEATEGDILLHWQPGAEAEEKHMREIYLVIDAEDWNGIEPDPYTVNGYGILSSHFKATFVDDAHTLTLNLSGSPTEQQPMGDDAEAMADHAGGIARDIQAGAAIVNNLVGMQTARFEIHRTGGEERVKIALRNTQYTYPNPAEGSDGIIGGEPFEPQGVYGVNTRFWGDIIADAGVDVDKIGPGRLTVGFEREHTGSLQLVDGTLSLLGGGLTLTGTGNTMSALRFARDAETIHRAATDEEPGDILLRHGHTSIGSILEDNEPGLSRQGGDIALQDGALLTLTGKSELADTTILHVAADNEPAGELQMAEGGELKLNGAAQQLGGVGLVLEDGGLLDVGASAANSVLGITGGGALAGMGAQLSITGNMESYFSQNRGVSGYVFSGALNGGMDDGTRNTLTVEKDAWFKMQNATGGSGWDMDNHGELIIDLGYAENNTKLGDITLRSGSTTTLIVDTDKGSRTLPTLHGGMLTVEQGAKFILDTTGSTLEGEACAEGTRFGVAWVSGDRREMDKADFVKGSGLLHYDIDDKYIERGVFWLVFTKTDNNPFERPGMDKNPNAGAGLIWDATDPEKNDKWGDMKGDSSSDLNKVVDSLIEKNEAGDWDGVQSTLAALAGASTSAVGMAAIEDIHRQLRTTRNRSVTSASERCWNGVNCPTLFHAYIMGEGNYHKMNADRYAPGFTFSNWGGTVGMDVDIDRRGTDSKNVGLALTAMYGNLTVDAADRAKGDLDTQYITAFGRVTKGKWQHVLVFSAGLMDLTLNRTVSYGSGAYTTHGSTDGHAIGGIYELGYNAFTNDEGTKCLQLVANAEARHISLKGYTETSTSDAALHVGGSTQEIFTFGLGARYRAVAGYNVWNRASTFEARLLAKADVGDHSGTVSNALINGTSRREEVESSKLGAFGIEAGAGITIPCGRCGSFFIDTSLELRHGYLNADANAGYRMTF